jgi:soluble lytic murein transglycosylase-like protein
MGTRLTRNLQNVSVLALLACSTALSQSNTAPAAPQPLPAPADQVGAAMRKSLEQQQAALDDFRENAQAISLRQQHESAIKQVEPLRLDTALPPSALSPPPSSSQALSASKSTAFFTLPWPGSLSLSVPNVQMPSDACDALESTEVSKLVQGAAIKHGLSPDLLRSVMKQESAFKPCALSTAGAMGLMQIMPETADMLHLDDPFDPAKNVDAGATFLKTMLDRFGGDVTLALSAYNAGPGAVDKAGGVPPIAETLRYLSNILGDLPAAY